MGGGCTVCESMIPDNERDWHDREWRLSPPGDFLGTEARLLTVVPDAYVYLQMRAVV